MRLVIMVIMINLGSYGFEESMGIHIILSNLFWWASLILVIAAYKNRMIWNVGEMPWTFLFLGFLFFGIRELGHFTSSPLLGSIRYIFGIGSAIFMASAFIIIFVKICKRKDVPPSARYIPFIIALIFPIFLIMKYLSREGIENIRSDLSNMENIVWLVGSSITIYTSYMLGTKSTGGFVHFFMFFQLSAITAFLWKFTAVIASISCPIPYSIREIIETTFGVFAIISIYILEKMLRNLSKRIS